MEQFKKFAKDIWIVGLMNILLYLKGFFTLPIISKAVNTHDYGIWSQISVTISLCIPLICLGLPYTLVRYLAAEKDKEQIQEGIYSTIFFVFSVALFVLSIFLIFPKYIANFFGTNEILVIRITGLVILVECLNLVLLNIFRAFQEIKKYAFFTLFNTFGAIFLIALFVSKYKLKGIISALLLINLITFLVMSFLIFKNIGFKFPRFSRIKEYLSFGLSTISGNISNWAVQSSDRYFIGYFLGPTFVAYYSPAYTLGTIINMFLTPFSVILPPVLAKSFDEKKLNEFKTYLKYSLKYFLLLAIPSMFGLSILSKPILRILSTSDIANNGFYITPFVTLSILFLGIKSIIGQPIMILKKTKINSAIWSLAAIVNIGLNFIFVPKWGILGAALTTLIAYFIILIATIFIVVKIVVKYLKLDFDYIFMFKSIFAASLMSIVIYKLKPHHLSNLFLSIIIGAIIYIIILILLKSFKKNELEFFKFFIKST